MGLFDTVPQDHLQFGIGRTFQPKLVADFLRLSKKDVSHVASVAVSSVRYDDAIPEKAYQRLEEISHSINLVAQLFEGDRDKTVTWFRTSNPMLGDISPRDMIRLGRYERLSCFIVNAMADCAPADRSVNAPVTP